VPPVVEGDVERPGVADGQGVADPRSGGAREVLGLGYAGRERPHAVVVLAVAAAAVVIAAVGAQPISSSSIGEPAKRRSSSLLTKSVSELSVLFVFSPRLVMRTARADRRR
jgi:hypothetical protein